MGTRTETYSYCDACGADKIEIVLRVKVDHERVQKTFTHELCPACRDALKAYWQQTYGKALYT